MCAKVGCSRKPDWGSAYCLCHRFVRVTQLVAMLVGLTLLAWSVVYELMGRLHR